MATAPSLSFAPPFSCSAIMQFFATLVTVALAASSALAQLTVNTPILPGNQPTAQALHDFGQVTGNSITWTVNIAAGTSIGLTLRDSTGSTAQSAPFTINAGSKCFVFLEFCSSRLISLSAADSSCVGKDPSSSGSPSTAGNTSPAPSSPAATTAPTTTAPGATTTPTTPAPGTTTPQTTAAAA
ncbi:hypothetical protein H0H87_005409 [Tephrocybe sp. NHM501043]|nr:hypothetical protein H0H87_005409 [Tephrocybe sp. NHM501043]